MEFIILFIWPSGVPLYCLVPTEPCPSPPLGLSLHVTPPTPIACLLHTASPSSDPGLACGTLSSHLHLCECQERFPGDVRLPGPSAGNRCLTLIGLDCELLPEEGKHVLLLMCHGHLWEEEEFMRSAVGFTAHAPFRLLCTDTSQQSEAWSTGLWREDTDCQTQATGTRTDGSLLLMLPLSCSGLEGLMGWSL